MTDPASPPVDLVARLRELEESWRRRELVAGQHSVECEDPSCADESRVEAQICRQHADQLDALLVSGAAGHGHGQQHAIDDVLRLPRYAIIRPPRTRSEVTGRRITEHVDAPWELDAEREQWIRVQDVAALAVSERAPQEPQG